MRRTGKTFDPDAVLDTYRFVRRHQWVAAVVAMRRAGDPRPLDQLAADAWGVDAESAERRLVRYWNYTPPALRAVLFECV